MKRGERGRKDRSSLLEPLINSHTETLGCDRPHAIASNPVASQRGDFMSFRNGDKSRENRIRKARQKMREKVRELQPKDAKAKGATSASKK